MISGAHVIVYSKNAEADRAFFRDVLQFASVDAGHGWLIFALPPAEAAVHPSDESGTQEVYFMCDDLKAEMASLAKKNVECSEVQEARMVPLRKKQTSQLPGSTSVFSNVLQRRLSSGQERMVQKITRATWK
jgi:hypothetical protein